MHIYARIGSRGPAVCSRWHFVTDVHTYIGMKFQMFSIRIFYLYNEVQRRWRLGWKLTSERILSICNCFRSSIWIQRSAVLTRLKIFHAISPITLSPCSNTWLDWGIDTQPDIQLQIRQFMALVFLPVSIVLAFDFYCAKTIYSSTMTICITIRCSNFGLLLSKCLDYLIV